MESMVKHLSCEIDSTTNDDTSCFCNATGPQNESPIFEGQLQTCGSVASPWRPPPISTTAVVEDSITIPEYHPPVTSSRDSLLLPTLSESRNDREWDRFPLDVDSPQSWMSKTTFQVSTSIAGDGDECEVAIQNDGNSSSQTQMNETGDDSPAATTFRHALSAEELERKTDQIIQEARMAVLRQRQALQYSESLRRQKMIELTLQHRTKHDPDNDLEVSEFTAVPPRIKSEQNAFGTSRSFPQSPNDVDRIRPRAHDKGNATALLRSTEVEPLDVWRTPTNDGRPPLSPLPPSGTPTMTHQTISINEPCMSPAESSLGSIDDNDRAINKLPFPVDKKGPSDLREKVLRRIDGIVTSPVAPINALVPAPSFGDEDNSIISPIQPASRSETEDVAYDGTMFEEMPTRVRKVKTVVIKSAERKKPADQPPSKGSWFNFFWSADPSQSSAESDHVAEEYEGAFALMNCGEHQIPQRKAFPTAPTSLVRVSSREYMQGYAEAFNSMHDIFIDPRMPDWIDKQFCTRGGLPKNGTYQLGESRSVIVHELIRGSWTWCTAWSPDGRRLALGTENHHLAVVDTYSSSVWRVKHDRRVNGPTRGGDVTHSIRSIAWGQEFIAIGGVGGSVSILSPIEPYPILHKISPTGFVGSLDWWLDTNTLVIGSRNGKAMIVKIWSEEAGEETAHEVNHENIKVSSAILHTIDRESAWVNAIKFSPGGRAVAVGDSKGFLGVHSYEEVGSTVKISNLANFQLEDSILDVEWSPDGQWLYAGGEDFVVTVINTPTWEAIHRIKRDRWVQFIAASNGGSHVAIGGVSSEVSIMDVDRGWDTAINVSLKGLLPLSAKWHPQDQYLVITGQNNSVLAVETTNSRYISGHFLRSVSPILDIEFSPNGRMAAIGNEAGVVTIFKLTWTTFTTTYELVLDGDGSLSIEWSKSGSFLAVVAGSKVVIIAKSNADSLPESTPANTSGFHVAQVIRDFESVNDVSISPKSRYVAISGMNKTKFLDSTANFKCIREVAIEGTTISNSWSPDGSWFATIGKNQHLLIFDTSSQKPSEWREIFSVQTQQPGLALAWGPSMMGGLQYCAYGGEGKKIYIMEIRTKERSWETILSIPREGVINDLDWNDEGLLAAAIGNGTVAVADLSYLQSGWAVNEMDYNWQRQALTCFTEIRRNKGKNSMKSVRWIPSAQGSDSLLALGGTDGEVEIIDLTDRRRCSGYQIAAAMNYVE